MNRKYEDAELQLLADDMIEELRECEEGTVTSTAGMAGFFGYDDMQTEDLFFLHLALFRKAKEIGMTLDMSAHDGKDEGLPFALSFVVFNKGIQIRCPHCGSTDTARYLYGLPAFNEELEKKIESGKIRLGGCCIHADPNGKIQNPERYCNACKKDFLL